MERVAGKLDAIAQELFKVLVQNTGQQHFGKTVTVQGKESILSLFRYNHENETRSKPDAMKSSDHTLCLHFPTAQSQFSVQSERGPLSFEAGPDTIVVTVGKHFGVINLIISLFIFPSPNSFDKLSFSLMISGMEPGKFRKCFWGNNL